MLTKVETDPGRVPVQACVLSDRGVVAVAGADAATFLQGLVTSDVSKVAPGAARYAALLTPQGKIIADFLVAADGEGGYLLDCPSSLAGDLARRLGFYRLRAKVAVENRSDRLAVLAWWGRDAAASAAAFLQGRSGAAFPDPRRGDLGWRVVTDRGSADGLGRTGFGAGDPLGYEALRIELAVPKGGMDFVYGDTFPHEANLDRLGGVDFRKGCYVGQEVVSRVEHRGLARKRIVAIGFEGAPPAAGTEILAGDASLGIMGSSTHGIGLAMLRLDRVEDAARTGTAIMAGATALRLPPPEA